MLVDPSGAFPIDPTFRQRFPLLTAYIEEGMERYIQNSPRILQVLSTHSNGNLTSAQISQDFLSDKGPSILSKDYDAGLNQGGEYDYGSNSMIFDNADLDRFETLLGNANEDIQTWGKMEFSGLFLHEYVHYGDALDDYDAILDDNGDIINNTDPSTGREPTGWGGNIWEEGRAAQTALFPMPTGRQNYYLFKYGQYIDIRSPTVYETDEGMIDETMIPKN